MATTKSLGKVMITPGGTYSNLATYAPLTIVTYNGSSYLSLTTVQGIDPGVSPNWETYWQLIASIGEGIQSISLTGTEGLVDTYTIVYGNGLQYQFQLTNGAQGPQGNDGDTGPAGPTGATYTPSVSSEGEISWTNNGNLPNPDPVNIRGPQGEPGHGLQILGTYATLSALESAITSPAQGDMYNVGTSAPYTVYMWDETTPPGEWLSLGKLQGEAGATYTPSVSSEGEISWTNNGNLPNPDPVDITGPQGPAGQDAPQIDDTQITQDNPWSSQKIVETLCPTFSVSGAVVNCVPVLGSTLTVNGTDGQTTLWLGGNNLVGASAQAGTILTNYYGMDLTPVQTTTLYWLISSSGGTSLSGISFGIVYQNSGSSTPTTVWIVENGEPNAQNYPSGSFTSQTGATIGFVCSPASSDNWQQIFSAYDIMVSAGTAPTNYQAYNGTYNSVTLPTTLPAISGANVLYAFNGSITVSGYTYAGEGSGNVSSVNGFTPSFDGNVDLPGQIYPCTASALEALSSSDLVGIYNQGYRAVQATYNETVVTLGLAADGSLSWQGCNQGRTNLLDNPDFSNPINQRGLTTYSGSFIYSIDRWVISGTIILQSGGISVSPNGFFLQRMEPLINGEDYTLAVYVGNQLIVGTVTYDSVSSDTQVAVSNSLGTLYIQNIEGNLCQFAVNTGAQSIISMPVLLKGAYTAKTLPPWEAPDYATEYLKCRRYCRNFDVPKKQLIGICFYPNAVTVLGGVFDIPMRSTPTCSASGVTSIDSSVTYDIISYIAGSDGLVWISISNDTPISVGTYVYVWDLRLSSDL